jgi:deoxycytidylate deaminase
MMIADLSLCRFKMAAQIYKGAKPISVAVNHIKSHTEHKKYGSHVVSIHAEHSVILRARCDIVGSTLYVARYGGVTSMPCIYCRAYCSESGIHSIVYMLNNALYKEKL